MAVRQVPSAATVLCFVHGTPVPRAGAQEHHEAPRAAGGTDDHENLVWLCAVCHQVCHRIVQLRQTGKAGTGEDIKDQTYANKAQRDRCDRVVREMMIAHAHADTVGLGKPTAEVMLDIDHGVYTCLKALASERRVNGRSVGVAKYMVAVLTDHVTKQGMDPTKVRRR